MANSQLEDAKPPRAVARFTEADTTWQELILPDWARRVMVSPVTNAASIIVSFEPGVIDAQAYAATHGSETIAGDSKFSVPLSNGRSIQKCKVFTRVAASTVLEISIEEGAEG